MPAKATFMSEIYLIRHGQASFGDEDYDRLSTVGIRQSQVLADHLFAQGVRFDAVYSGPLKRQIDTAGAFCERFGARQKALREPIVLNAFTEYDAGGLLAARTLLGQDAEARSTDELDRVRQDKKAFQTYFADTVDRWLAGEFDSAGVETWPAFCGRVTQGLRRITSDNGRGRRVAVFTSGGPICAVLKMTLDLAGKTAIDLSWQTMNASVSCVKYQGDRLALAFFNNTTHLLLAQDPALLTYR
jgi:broad specificity phosphatase PhoE